LLCIFLSQGDIRDEMFIIHSGVAEAVKNTDGNQVRLHLVVEGDSCFCQNLLCKV